MAVLMASAWHGPASAQGSIEERLHRMEQRIRYLEQRLAAQDRTILQKDKQISGLKDEEDTPWFDKFGMGGKMELEAATVEDYQGTNITGIETVKVELDVAAEIDDWVSDDVVLAMGDESGVEVEEAFLTLAPPDTPLSIRIGKHGLPFAVYESGLISDALAKELGETGEDAAVRLDNLDRSGKLSRDAHIRVGPYGGVPWADCACRLVSAKPVRIARSSRKCRRMGRGLPARRLSRGAAGRRRLAGNRGLRQACDARRWL